jgi:uncharacterized protein
LKITVIAHPNSKNPRIEKDILGVTHVYVIEPPLQNKANQAITESLAKFYNVKKSQVILLSGAKSKNKLFEINV